MLRPNLSLFIDVSFQGYTPGYDFGARFSVSLKVSLSASYAISYFPRIFSAENTTCVPLYFAPFSARQPELENELQRCAKMNGAKGKEILPLGSIPLSYTRWKTQTTRWKIQTKTNSWTCFCTKNLFVIQYSQQNHTISAYQFAFVIFMLHNLAYGRTFMTQ